MRDTKGIRMTGTETYSFGEWLKQRRERLRLTQRELAVSVHCSVPMIKKIEADERHPSPELAELLAVALKVPETEKETFIEVARRERPVDVLWRVQDAAPTFSLPFHPPVTLPRPATPFVGRADELTELGKRLAHPNCRLLTLVGVGGVGKTRLSLAVTQAQQTGFVEGVAFVSLAAITDASLIPDVVARSLRLTLTGQPAEQVLAYLGRRSMLLLLDNCEQVEGDLTWLSDLLADAPGVKMLATSRERLHLAEEWVYAVPGLAQAAILFVETAQRAKQDFNAEAQQPSIARICQLVENLPLAVELAASWTPLMPCAQIADHIQRDSAILATDVRNIPDRHRSIQAVFDHSWNLLSAAEQSALMRLSVFRGGWQAEQALTVADADLHVLRGLVDKSLVLVAENGRCALHELVRQFASRKLDESGQESLTRQRHFDAYLALAAQLDVQQYSPQGMEAFARFDQEQDNLRAALAWSLDSAQAEMSLRLLHHLWFYWFRRGYSREGEHWTIRAITEAGDVESAPLCLALQWAFAFIFNQGRFGEAMPYLDKVLPMARRLEDAEALVMGLMAASWVSLHAEQALKRLDEAIAILQETIHLQHLLPMFYYTSGIWLQRSGRNDAARERYQRSLALYRQMGAVDMIADPLGLLGQFALQEGRLQEAYDLTAESVEAGRAAGRQVAFGDWGGIRLGVIQLYLGDLDAAERSFQDALLLLEGTTHDRRGQQEALAYLSEVALARGDVKAAADHLRASLDVCRLLYRQLQATQKLEGTLDALPVDLIALCGRAALVTAAQGHYERAATLSSIADALRAQSGSVMLPPLQARLDEAMTAIRAHLSESALDTAWKAGQSMSLTQAFTFLLG